MSEDCVHCGRKVSAGQGQFTPDRGFLCNTCHESLHIVPCSSCGQRYPSYEMKNIDGKLLCKKDVEAAARAAYEEYSESHVSEFEEESVFSEETPKFKPLDMKSIHDHYAEIEDLYKNSEAPEPVRPKQSERVAKEETLIHQTEHLSTGFVLADGQEVMVEEIIHRRIKYTPVQKGKLILSKFLLSLEELGSGF